MSERDALRVAAIRLLSRREYTRAALAARLAPVAASAEALEMVLDELAADTLLSDARAAEARVRTKAGRYGNRRLAQDLRAQGVGDEALADALALAGDELARCRLVWEKKFGMAPTDVAARAKQTRFLQTRGFALEQIRQVINQMDAS